MRLVSGRWLHWLQISSKRDVPSGWLYISWGSHTNVAATRRPGTGKSQTRASASAILPSPATTQVVRIARGNEHGEIPRRWIPFSPPDTVVRHDYKIGYGDGAEGNGIILAD
ncbi:MAG: hypothetical protein KatS3mg059_0818 [Thermomicrobiales bacterium]|nr:MAG: hypothetical protein KatS3mg059_0818 [Thermomicrobiales bacterium]